jgi:hypothetical protein
MLQLLFMGEADSQCRMRRSEYPGRLSMKMGECFFSAVVCQRAEKWRTLFKEKQETRVELKHLAEYWVLGMAIVGRFGLVLVVCRLPLPF